MIEAFLIWLSLWSPTVPAPAPSPISIDQPAPIQGSGH